MKKWLGFFGALLFSGVAIAQTTIVVGVATDSDSTLWANGTVSVQFVPNSSQSNLNVYRINGAPLSSAVTMQGPISLGSGGSFSVTVYDNTQVTPSGSQWQFTICPQATSKCGSVTTPVSGSGQSITTLIDAVIPAPRFPAVIGNYGYADVEAILQLVPGNIYYNVTNSCYRDYNGSIWSCIQGGTVNAGTAGQFAQYTSAGTAVSGVSPAIALSSMNGVGPVANVTNPIYGGKCDGVTDDTAAIQAAANTSMTVFLPWDGIPGHYCKISGTISLAFSGQSIIGSSKKYAGLGEVTPNTDAIHLGGSANNDNLGVYNLQVFYAGPSASGLVLTSTISGSTVTAITVSSGGTNFYAPPNIGVNGCWNVSTTATIPTLGGTISAVTVSAGGTCIPQTNVWAASMVVPGNWSFIDGNGYIEMASYTGGTAGSTEPTFTTVYGSTQTDGTITWTNKGLYGAVAWNGGSTSGVGAYVHPSGTTESDFFTVNSAYFNGFSTGIYFSGSGNARLWNVSTSSDSSSGAGIYTTGGATNSFVGIGISNQEGAAAILGSGRENRWIFGDCNGQISGQTTSTGGGVTLTGNGYFEISLGNNENLSTSNLRMTSTSAYVSLTGGYFLQGDGGGTMVSPIIINDGHLVLNGGAIGRAGFLTSVPLVKDTYNSIVVGNGFSNTYTSLDPGLNEQSTGDYNLIGTIGPWYERPVTEPITPSAGNQGECVLGLYRSSTPTALWCNYLDSTGSPNVVDVFKAAVQASTLQGTDPNLLTSGSVSGTGSTLCTDANGGATTSGCSGGSGNGFPITLGSTSVAASSTTPSIAGLTLTSPTITGIGTFVGSTVDTSAVGGLTKGYTVEAAGLLIDSALTTAGVVTNNASGALGTVGTTGSGGNVVLSTAPTFDAITGEAPFVVNSTTPVANLSIGGNAATATTLLSGAVVAQAPGDLVCAEAADPTIGAHTLTAGSSTSSTMTFTMASVPLFIQAGSIVQVQGATPSGYNGGPYTVTTVTSTTVTVSSTANPGTMTGFGTLSLYCSNQATDATVGTPGAPNTVNTYTLGANAISAGTVLTVNSSSILFSSTTAAAFNPRLMKGSTALWLVTSGMTPGGGLNSGTGMTTLKLIGFSPTLLKTDLVGNYIQGASLANASNYYSGPITIATFAQTLGMAYNWTATGLGSVSTASTTGCTVVGSIGQTVNLTSFNASCSGVATCTLVTANTLVGATCSTTSRGYGCTTTPTTSTCSAGTVTSASGTASSLTSTLVGAPGNAALQWSFTVTPF